MRKIKLRKKNRAKLYFQHGPFVPLKYYTGGSVNPDIGVIDNFKIITGVGVGK